jgi:hypothetical protein
LQQILLWFCPKSIRKLMLEVFFLDPFGNSCWQLFLPVDNHRLSLSHGMSVRTVCTYEYICKIQINPIESLPWNFFNTYSFPWLTPPPSPYLLHASAIYHQMFAPQVLLISSTNSFNISSQQYSMYVQYVHRIQLFTLF